MMTKSRAGTIAGVLLVLGVAAGATGGARERADASAPRPVGPQEVEVVAVVVDPRIEAPTVVLQGKRDRRTVALVIGVAEATGIALPLRGVKPPRPLTHDLFVTLFGRLNVSLTRVVITDLRDDVYYATIHLTGAGGEMTLDARPSDAIALALRSGVPVLVEDRVLDKGGSPDPSGRRRI
jgi:bifunctional DNase/RNase